MGDMLTIDPRVTSWLEAKSYCKDARHLLDQFGEAVQELVALHEQQFQAVVQGDMAAHRFDLLIHDANERKRNAKYRYMEHLEEHGCLYQDAIING